MQPGDIDGVMATPMVREVPGNAPSGEALLFYRLA